MTVARKAKFAIPLTVALPLLSLAATGAYVVRDFQLQIETLTDGRVSERDLDRAWERLQHTLTHHVNNPTEPVVLPPWRRISAP